MRSAAPPAAGDDQDRVVACDGPHDFREPRSVERFGKRLRLTAAGPDDHELLDALDVADEIRRGTLEGAQRRFRVGGVGAGALVCAIAGALHEAEVLDVARDRRLRRLEAALAEPAAQQLLAVEPFAVDQLEDDGLSASFHEKEA